jgi:hypothetical protein
MSRILFIYLVCTTLASCFESALLRDFESDNSIECEIDWIYSEDKPLSGIDAFKHEKEVINPVSLSIISYYRQFLIALSTDDESMVKTKELLGKADTSKMAFLKAGLSQRKNYSAYSLAATPRCIVKMNDNVYTLFLYSAKDNRWLLPVTFMMSSDKPLLYVNHDKTLIEQRSRLFMLLSKYLNFSPVKYEKITAMPLPSDSKIATRFKSLYVFSSIIIIVLSIVCIFYLKSHKKK